MEAYMHELGLSVSFGFFGRYHDDGYVPSLCEHEIELCKRYSRTPRNLPTELAVGRYLYVQHFGFSHYHLFYERQDFDKLDGFVRAHEETHILHRAGQLDILADKLRKEQRCAIDFDSIDDSELIADIGAIFAYMQKNSSDWGLNMISTMTNIDDALHIYKKSKI